MDDIDTKKLLKAFIGDMDPFKKNLIKIFIAVVLLMLIYRYIWCVIYEKHPCDYNLTKFFALDALRSPI